MLPAKNRLTERIPSMGLTATERLDQALLECLGAYPAGLHVGVAFSGGMDSMALLHALSRLRDAGRLSIRLSALHVHHGLSPNADAWATFCGDACRDLSVSLRIVPVNVPRDSGEGLEAAARRLRYAAFADFDVDCLALAHHRDDQIETVLLNLLRGAGVVGAAGMPKARMPRLGARLIRPLLDVPRQWLAHYADEHGLRWIDDESNDNRHFRRNFLRHEILPAIDEKFPTARQAVARAAERFGEAAALLDQLAELDGAEVRQPSGRLGLASFNRLDPARARNLLRHAWQRAGFRAPEARWVEEARKQLAMTEAQSETCIATLDGALRVYRGELYFVPATEPFPTAPIRWRGESSVPWGSGTVRFEPVIGGGISRERLVGGYVELRVRCGGEHVRLNPKRPRRSVRNLFLEAAIPPWERTGLPLLWVDDQLAWVAELGVDAGFACGADEAGLLPAWVPSVSC